MINKFASMLLVAALVCTLAGTPAFADTLSKREAKTQPEVVTESDKVVNEKLRSEIFKLVAETKAARNEVKFPQPQIQSPQRNNMSQGTKIAIGVAIAAAVVAVILISTRCNNEPGSC
jgi:hypothetical protein